MINEVYLIDKYDRWCPENNNGQYIVAVFSTRELAQAYIDKHDPKNKDGKRLNPDGLSILEMNLDKGRYE